MRIAFISAIGFRYFEMFLNQINYIDKL